MAGGWWLVAVVVVVVCGGVWWRMCPDVGDHFTLCHGRIHVGRDRCHGLASVFHPKGRRPHLRKGIYSGFTSVRPGAFTGFTSARERRYRRRGGNRILQTIRRMHAMGLLVLHPVISSCGALRNGALGVALTWDVYRCHIDTWVRV